MVNVPAGGMGPLVRDRKRTTSDRETVEQIVLFALLGLGTGALIAGIALGIVVTYRGTGVINLATGSLAMIAGYIFWALRTGDLGFTLGTVPAGVVTLAALALIGVLMELVAFRPLRTAPPLAKLVSSLGLLLVAQATVQLLFGTSPLSSPAVLPDNTVNVFDVLVPINRFILAAVVITIAIVLMCVYRFSRFGVSTRAASENQAWAVLAGLSPNGLSMRNTLIANTVVGLIGILAASVVSIDSTSLPLLIVPALVAALFARFTSIPTACAVGLAIGIVQSLLYYASTQTWFPTVEGTAVPGAQEVLTLLLIVAALWWRGASLPRRGDIEQESLPLVPRQDQLLRRVAVPAAICAVALIVLPYDFRQAVTTGLVITILCLSLVVVTGYVGQLSVVQLALSGVAGFTVSHLGTDLGVGFPFAALAGIAVAVAFGLAIAYSALRVRGVSLVVVTLAAAVAIEQFIFSNPSWGGGESGAPVGQPHIFGINLGTDAGFRGLDGLLPSVVFGIFALAVTVALYVLVANLRRSNLGRHMLAVRSNERAAAAVGVDVRNVKIVAFGIGSAIAGVAGVMYAYNFGSVSATHFDAITALSLIASVYVTGVTMPQGAVLAGFAATGAVIPLIMQKWVLPADKIGIYTVLLSGVFLLLQLNMFPDGITGTMWRRKEAKKRRRAAAKVGSGKLYAVGATSGGAVRR